MKSLISAVILSTVLIATLSSSTTAPEPAVAAVSSDLIRSGTASGWWVQSDGTVALRLDGTHQDKKFSLWFVTPPSRTATTRFEELVMQALMAGETSGRALSLVVTSDPNSGGDGSTVAEAMPIHSLGQM